MHDGPHARSKSEQIRKPAWSKNSCQSIDKKGERLAVPEDEMNDIVLKIPST